MLSHIHVRSIQKYSILPIECCLLIETPLGDPRHPIVVKVGLWSSIEHSLTIAGARDIRHVCSIIHGDGVFGQPHKALPRATFPRIVAIAERYMIVPSGSRIQLVDNATLWLRNATQSQEQPLADYRETSITNFWTLTCICLWPLGLHNWS